MSEFQPEPLAPDLLRLLAAEKSRPAPPASMQSRVLERLGADLLADIPLSGPPGSGLARTGSHSPSRLPSVSAGRLPMAVGLIALGGLGGAGLHAWLHAARQRTLPPPTSPAAPAPAVTPMPEPDARVAVVHPDQPALVEPHRTASSPARRQAPAVQPATRARDDSPAPARDNELAAERALLEQARMALARGRAADALALLARHAHEFADGRLTEEREALTILSLVANQQVDEARSAAAKFRRNFPGSMLMRSIDAALETIQ
jgi:hypothetical protein